MMSESAHNVLHTIAEHGVLTIAKISEHTGLAHEAVDSALSALIRHQKLRRFHSPGGNSYGLARGVEVAPRPSAAPSTQRAAKSPPTPAPATEAAEAAHQRPHNGLQADVLNLLQESKEPLSLKALVRALSSESMPVRTALKRLQHLKKISCQGRAGAGRWSIVKEESLVPPSASIEEASPCASESAPAASVSPPAPSSAMVDAPTGPSPVASVSSGARTPAAPAKAAAARAPEPSTSTAEFPATYELSLIPRGAADRSALFQRVMLDRPGVVAGVADLAKGLRELLDHAIDEDAPASVLKRIAEHAFNAQTLSGHAAPPESRS